MRNIRLTIQYDGTNYSGWQIQPNAVTIQEMLQQTIARITGETPTVLCAGRTDSGVHAIAQVSSFKTSSSLGPDILKKAMNACLPEDIRVLDACDEKADFNPRYSAHGKRYIYIVSCAPIVSPFLSGYVWGLCQELDVKAMEQGLSLLKGSHDFSAFRGAGCGANTTVRTITGIAIKKLDSLEFMTIPLKGEFVAISIEADAFLRHMVRNIVGTVVELGKGRLCAADMQRILLSRDRINAGPTAPARGLFLERIFYEDSGT